MTRNATSVTRPLGIIVNTVSPSRPGNAPHRKPHDILGILRIRAIKTACYHFPTVRASSQISVTDWISTVNTLSHKLGSIKSGIAAPHHNKKICGGKARPNYAGACPHNKKKGFWKLAALQGSRYVRRG